MGSVTKTREWISWCNMRRRCHSPKATGYKFYGGQGISVCERWRNSFENFLADVGPCPSSDHSLDRINPSGNYEPSNVRWATRAVQYANRRPFVIGRKLTPENVAEIRRLAGKVSRHKLAERFSVAYDSITDIVLRRTWKKVA